MMSSLPVDTEPSDFVAQQRTVELHTTHRRQVIAVFGEEQVLEQAFSRCFTSRRLTVAHHAVDFLPAPARSLVGSTRTVSEMYGPWSIVGKQRFDTLVAGLAQLSQQIRAQLHVRRADQLASDRQRSL